MDRMPGGLHLVLDTAFARCAAGVFDPVADRLVAAVEPEIGKGHAERLIPIIDEALERAGAGYADVGRIGVTVGPGSFTGVRVGVSAARGFALALGVPAVGVPTLEAMAAPWWHERAPILAVLDAKRGEVYAALYDEHGQARLDPAAVATGRFVEWVRTGLHAGEAPALVGSGARLAADIMAANPDLPDPPILDAEARIDLAALARLVAARDARDAPAKPLYLRSADAKPAARHPALFPS